ncbi:hypothetical protein SAMN05444487_10449 [Marininema mesophilum]|uniref:Uncharacterized protein n=1 Tax=Marininema mesophilum TaxID=1048340 RepID=A0A1H2UAR2_9BACL|nr:CD1247 N-terminal domain-containing protein [Marininema mesophilum]SDW53150.1 hypothetical protein SAMN05444487_10449 [Marininema mesophilum]
MEADTNHLHRDVAFIQGLMAGSQGIEQTPQGTILQRIVSVLDELVEENEQIQIRLTELEEYAEAVDEDLNEVELLVYDEDLWDDEGEEVEVVAPEKIVTLDEDDAS